MNADFLNLSGKTYADVSEHYDLLSNVGSEMRLLNHIYRATFWLHGLVCVVT